MSKNLLKKSYSVVVIRDAGNQLELETVAEYAQAVSTAKTALESPNNLEVRIVENNYDDATRRDRKQVIKIFNKSNISPQSSTPSPGRAAPQYGTGLKPEVAQRATKGIVYIVIAVTILILIIGIMLPMITR
ncbi:MAG: hypothetical protein ABID63_02030 [Pseudomonadota bacterium]